MKRLKYGATNNMSKEEYKEYKRNLQRKWRHKHPDWVKKQNHKWWVTYKKTKPCICICKYCGNEFNAPRKYYLICPDCAKKPKKTELFKMEVRKRREEKLKMIAEAINGYKQGITQEVLAECFGVTQKTISNWVNRKNKLQKRNK